LSAIGEDTKARIVDAALRLWNEQGIARVTTNHVAAHLGMSPGNLYYHFRNKDEIVRAAFDRMNLEADEVWALPEGRIPDLEDLRRFLLGNLRLYRAYVSLARELPALVRADVDLRKSYRKVHARRVQQLGAIVDRLTLVGLLRLPDDAARTALIESAWIVGSFWVPYLEMKDANATNAEIARGARLVLALMRPYFADGVHDVLAQGLEG
jgi:AcrR family transcriptional regulator